MLSVSSRYFETPKLSRYAAARTLLQASIFPSLFSEIGPREEWTGPTLTATLTISSVSKRGLSHIDEGRGSSLGTIRWRVPCSVLGCLQCAAVTTFPNRSCSARERKRAKPETFRVQTHPPIFTMLLCTFLAISTLLLAASVTGTDRNPRDAATLAGLKHSQSSSPEVNHTSRHVTLNFEPRVGLRSTH